MDDRYYIVNGRDSGLFFGKIRERNGQEVTMTDCRRLWYWNGACSELQIAAEGVKNPQKSKFTMTVDEITILDAIEIIPCTDAAAENIKSVEVWKI